MQHTYHRRPTVALAFDAHARSQMRTFRTDAPRVASEPRTISPAIAEVLRNTFG